MNRIVHRISDKTRILEITAVVITAIGKFVFMDWLNWRFPFVAVAILAWTGYIIYRKKRTLGVLEYWGFRKDTFTPVLKLLLPLGLISIACFMGIGIWQETIQWTWHILPILITYPLWGIIQQFLIIALIAGNLQGLRSVKLDKRVVILLTAVLFSVVHFPSYWLMGGTFLLALVYGFVYLKIKNLYVLGLFHGWLGAIFYYTVVGSDPFADIFLKMIS